MPLRLLIVVTYRDSDLTRAHPLTSVLADLRREAGVERIALHGLDDAAVVALMTAAARTDRYDLNGGAGTSVDYPKPADPAAAQAGQLVAERLGDRRIGAGIAPGGAN